jgi:hypothetical protein
MPIFDEVYILISQTQNSEVPLFSDFTPRIIFLEEEVHEK